MLVFNMSKKSKKGISLVIGNQKGGVGKSTAVVLTAIELGRLGKKVGVIDLDGQQNASYILLNYLGMKSDTNILPDHPHTGEVCHVTQAILGNEFEFYKTEHQNVSILPNNGEIADMQTKIEGMLDADGLRFLRGLGDRLKSLIDFIIEESGFDLIILDTPPSLTFPQLAAFMAADKALLVTQLEHLSAESGVPSTLSQIQEYNSYYRIDNQIEVVGILENMVSYQNLKENLLRKEQQKTHEDLKASYPKLINENLRLSLLEALKITKIPTENKITSYKKDKRANEEVTNFINYLSNKIFG